MPCSHPSKTNDVIIYVSFVMGKYNFDLITPLLLRGVSLAQLVILTWGTWWVLLALLVYGTIYSSSHARWHECGHGTPFRTRWLNVVFYHISSFMSLREAYMWRWSHSRHHTHMIVVGRDPEIQVTHQERSESLATSPVSGDWVEVCDADDLEEEDVIRFDHNGVTYKVFIRISD